MPQSRNAPGLPRFHPFSKVKVFCADVMPFQFAGVEQLHIPYDAVHLCVYVCLGGAVVWYKVDEANEFFLCFVVRGIVILFVEFVKRLVEVCCACEWSSGTFHRSTVPSSLPLASVPPRLGHKSRSVPRVLGL